LGRVQGVAGNVQAVVHIELGEVGGQRRKQIEGSGNPSRGLLRFLDVEDGHFNGQGVCLCIFRP